MLYESTLNEIRTSNLPCIEYEIGMFLCLLTNPVEIKAVKDAASTRSDYKRIMEIANVTNKDAIHNILSYAGMNLVDVSYESQNDEVGPADIVIHATNRHREKKKIGISVKYDNDCICNYTGRDILTEDQISGLKELIPEYAEKYLREMVGRFGSFKEWYRIRFNTKQKVPSTITSEYIDLIRDAVINRWESMTNEEKDRFLYKVYRTDSPLDYWIYSFQKKGKFILCTNPPYIRRSAYSRVTVNKIAGQYLGFYLDKQLLGKTQIKFNNGILERYSTKKLKEAQESKDQTTINRILSSLIAERQGIVIEGIPLKYGKPFTSWNYEISY
jgi:hypothetical protein